MVSKRSQKDGGEAKVAKMSITDYMIKPASKPAKKSSKATKESANEEQNKKGYSSFWQMQWDRSGRCTEALSSVQVPDLKQEAYRLKLLGGKKTAINKANRGMRFNF